MLPSMIQENIDSAAVSGSYYFSCLPLNLQMKIQACQVKFYCYQGSKRQLLIMFRSFEDRMAQWGSDLQSEILEKIKDAKVGPLASDIDELLIAPDSEGAVNRVWGKD